MSGLQSNHTPEAVLDFVLQEREKSLSPREWRHRLAGYGYGIADTAKGQVVKSLISRKTVCALP